MGTRALNMSRTGNVEAALIEQLNTQPETNLVKRVQMENQLIKHNYQKSFEKEYACALSGCNHLFTLTIIPNQIIYPKYCEEHRNEYKRQQFLENTKQQFLENNKPPLLQGDA
jgi:hypothetical protein